MKKLLVDTNVFVDYFAHRGEFEKPAKLLLFGCAMGDYEIWMSSSQVTDLHFVLTHGREKQSEQEATDTIRHLRECVRIAALSESDVDEALEAGWSDFEDSCVYFVAKRLKAHYIITRNKKDFAQAKIPVLLPEEFLALMEEEHGIIYDEIDF